MRLGILSLDLGLTTGWAYGVGEEPPVSGAFTFNHIKGSGARGAAFRDWLEGHLSRLDPRYVVFETAMSFSKGQNARKILDGLAWETELICFDLGYECQEETPQKVKSHFTGNGNAGKPLMMSACRRRGWEFPDHNGADALALYDFALMHFFPEDWRRLQAGLDLLATLPRAGRAVEEHDE